MLNKLNKPPTKSTTQPHKTTILQVKRMKTLNLQLHITKNHNLKDYQTGKYIRFAVTDLDISKRYPSNFVTILPRHIYLKAKIPSNFVKKYEEQSHKIAKKLLKKALRTHEDQEIKKEIRERLKLLAPKPKKLVTHVKARCIKPNS
jgi:hypothetical protein